MAGKRFDAIELYNNPKVPLDFVELATLQGIVASIHNPHSHGWHEFFLQNDEQAEQWKQTQQLADFFGAQQIIVHPSRGHALPDLFVNLEKIHDQRIIVENMAGCDIDNQPMRAGQTLEDLEVIRKHYAICFDLEKAVKAAVFQGLDYRNYITKAIASLQPDYFQLSGGDKDSPIDEHQNLWKANFDIAWIKQQLVREALNRDILLVLETPKAGSTLENDCKNLEFFKSV